MNKMRMFIEADSEIVKERFGPDSVQITFKVQPNTGMAFINQKIVYFDELSCIFDLIIDDMVSEFKKQLCKKQ